MKFLISFSFSLFLFLSVSAQKTANYFPEKGKNWEQISVAQSGFNSAKLEEAVQFAKDHEYSGAVDLRQAILKGFEYEPYHKILGPTKKRGGPAGMILKNGYVVASWGDIHRVDMTFSVTKSYLSTVCGLAVDHQLIDSPQDKVIDYVWDGTFDGKHNASITWDHLLTQSSDWTGQLWGGYDWADRPPKEGNVDDWKLRTLRTPGTVMEYNDVRVNVLAYSLLQVWRKPLPQVLKEHVMDPIGASSTWRWFGYENSWTNVDGIKMQSVSGGGHSGGGIFISAADHARFGLLFLNDGNWNGNQIISKSWIEQATTSSNAEANYGYMWWLNKEGKRSSDKLPKSMFYAAGFGGNYIIIDKENDLVVVTRWLEPSKMFSFMEKVHAAIE